MKMLSLLYPLLLLSHMGAAQMQPGIEWQKALGGTLAETPGDIKETTDGGYIAIGSTTSHDGDVSSNHGLSSYDIWIVKTDKLGQINWQKSYGSSSGEQGRCIEQTNDGGYILCGSTRDGKDGDVVGARSYFNDAWVVKLDNKGNILWQKCLGGSRDDDARMIKQTNDGGFILVGFTYSNDGDVSGFHDKYPTAGADVWVVKLDANGNIDWQKCLGGDFEEVGQSIKPTFDGGYILCGYTLSINGDVKHNNGSTDAWVVKLDDRGNVIWEKTFGTIIGDGANDIIQTEGGDYIFTGWMGKLDSNSTNFNEQRDILTGKLDVNGNTVWIKTYGGSKADWANRLLIDNTGNIIVGGATHSNDGDINGRLHENPTLDIDYDLALVSYKTDGTFAWDMIMGGTGIEYASSFIQSSDQGFVILGNVTSTDGDATGCGFHSGPPNYGDFWLIKLGAKFYPTEIQSVPGTTVNVFPTVTDGLVKIYLPLGQKDANIYLFDAVGRSIPFTTSDENNYKTIKLENIPAGTYVLKIVTGDKISTQKIIFSP